jgi:CheY-like chemotaxis protein
VSDRKGTLSIDVADTGIGIAKDRVDSIFEPFVQENRLRNPSSAGTGLGLTISSRLADMLGGKIVVQSELNKGSCFSLRLPINDIDVSDLRSADELLGRANTHDSSIELDFFVPARVLIAEDTRAIQFMMRRVLESFVGSVTVVENGQLAIEAVLTAIQDRKPFDIIFMDIQMPVVNGYEATKQLRSLGIETPVIALTAGAMSGEREKCLAAGCNEYLPKPVHRNDLVNAVQKYGQPSRHGEI